MVPNSCATHALVSIMLNLPKDNLGPTLTKLKDHVEGIEDSETKGWAIGNCPELAQVKKIILTASAWPKNALIARNYFL